MVWGIMERLATVGYDAAGIVPLRLTRDSRVRIGDYAGWRLFYQDEDDRKWYQHGPVYPTRGEAFCAIDQFLHTCYGDL